MKKLTPPVLRVGSAANTPEIRYLTGFIAPDPVAVLCFPKKTILIVSSMEYGRALKQSVNCTVESPDTLNVPSELTYSMTGWIECALQKYSVTTLSVSPNFPLAIGKTLEAAGYVVEIKADTFIAKRRVIKTEDEIENIAFVQKVTRKAMCAVGRVITEATPGRGGILRWKNKILTSERAREIVRETVLKYNCIDMDTIIAGGLQATDPHQCGEGPLRTGEFVVCDIFPQSLETGYWGDMTRTFINGPVTAEQQRLYQTVKAAHDLGLKAVKPGVTGKSIHTQIVQYFDGEGYETFTDENGIPHGFFHSTGHGVGIEIHEEPRISFGGGKLKENMVVTIEPGLYYPELGGVRYEDLIVIRKDGAQVL